MKEKNREATNNSGVYEIKCDDLDTVYCGQGKRNIEIRKKEHQNLITKGIRDTDFSEHFIDMRYTFSRGNIRLIHNEQKRLLLNLWGQMEIKRQLSKGETVINNWTIFSSSL